WPIPNEYQTYFRQCRKAITNLVNDSDVPVIDGEAIRAKARSMQCELLYSRTGDANWNVLADRYLAQVSGQDGLLAAMIREDRRQRGSHPGLLDPEEAPGAEWTRAWSTLGLADITGVPSGYGTGGFGIATP